MQDVLKDRCTICNIFQSAFISLKNYCLLEWCFYINLECAKNMFQAVAVPYQAATSFVMALTEFSRRWVYLSLALRFDHCCWFNKLWASWSYWRTFKLFIPTSSGFFASFSKLSWEQKRTRQQSSTPFFCNYSRSSITWREFWFWVIHLISPFLYGGMCTCLIFLSGRKSIVMRVISCSTGWICELEIFKGWYLTLIHVCFL